MSDIRQQATGVKDDGATPFRCWFCTHSLEPDYKDVDVLKGFISARGKILSKRITRTCAKHQRRLASAIKLARQMALLR